MMLLGLLLVASTVACAQRAATPQTGAKVDPAPGNVRGAVWRDIPPSVDANAKYLFYLHGRIIEEQGINAVSPTFGAYEYERILQTFVEKGFIVISEPRPKGTEIEKYAAHVARQIKTLLQAGVPPRKITVVGASKGGGIAGATSAQLKNRDINFVLLAACSNSELYGNILSIWDYRDDTGAATCNRTYAQAPGVNKHKEAELKLGLGHGLLYRPLKEWVDLVVEWANQS